MFNSSVDYRSHARVLEMVVSFFSCLPIFVSFRFVCFSVVIDVPNSYVFGGLLDGWMERSVYLYISFFFSNNGRNLTVLMM